MGFFNDIIADARPFPESIDEGLNTEQQHPKRLSDEALHPVFQVEEPERADFSKDISERRVAPSSRIFSREVEGAFSPARISASERPTSGQDQKSSISLNGEGFSTRLPDRDEVESAPDPKTDFVLEKRSIEGQKFAPLPEPGHGKNPAETMGKDFERRNSEPKSAVERCDRQSFWEEAAEESAEAPEIKEKHLGPAGVRKAEIEPLHHEFFKAGLLQPSVAEEGKPEPPTPATREKQTEKQDSPGSEVALREIAPTSPPAEKEFFESLGKEAPIQPQINIGSIEVIVEVSGLPPGEKPAKSGALSQNLSSRYYLRRV